jgi:hypothetical protein
VDTRVAPPSRVEEILEVNLLKLALELPDIVALTATILTVVLSSMLENQLELVPNLLVNATHFSSKD